MCALLGDMQRNGYCEYHGVSSLGTVNEFGYRSCKSSRKESAYACDVHSQGFRINRPPASRRPGGALLSVRDTKSQIFHIKDRYYVCGSCPACLHARALAARGTNDNTCPQNAEKAMDAKVGAMRHREADYVQTHIKTQRTHTYERAAG